MGTNDFPRRLEMCAPKLPYIFFDWTFSPDIILAASDVEGNFLVVKVGKESIAYSASIP
jgi:hypothetical protein